MNLYISHMSALRYWRQQGGLGDSRRITIRSLSKAITSVKDARLLNPKEIGLIMTENAPLDVLVGCKGERRYAKDFHPHTWQTELPSSSFCKIAPNLYVSSPEFVYVQLASQLSLVELAQLGNELCGGYYLLATSGYEKREQGKQLTTRYKLEKFVTQIGDVRGARKALRALRWVTDHCNSPMETNAMLALCLPTRMGGWSLRIPVVNKSVRASKRMQRYVDGAMYTPDFTWTREVDGKIIRITGEYDSHEFHDEESQAEYTRIRRNNMKTMGYLVTSINKSQMADAWKLQYPARQIARDLGLYRPVPDAKMLARQNNLLRLLSRESFR